MKLLIALALLCVFAATQGAPITTYQIYSDVPIEAIPQIRTGGGLLGGLPLLGGSSLLGSSSYPWGGAVYGGGLLNNNFLPVQLAFPNLLSSLLVNI